MKNIIIAAVLAIACLLGYAIYSQNTGLKVGVSGSNLATMLSATSTNATSSAISVAGAKKISLFLSDDVGISGYGTTTISVLATADDTNYFTYNKLIDNVANTNSQNLTRVASKSVSATTTAYLLSLDLTSDALSRIKVVAVTAGISTTTVKALVEY